MPRNLYASGPDPECVVEVSWPGKRYDGWELTVSLGGRKLGVIPNVSALAAGRTFTISGSSSVLIQLTKDKMLIASAGGMELACVENSFSKPATKRLNAVINMENDAAVRTMIDTYKGMHPEAREYGRKVPDFISAYRLVLVPGVFLIMFALLSVTYFGLYILLDPFYALYGQMNFPFTFGGGVLFIFLGLLAKRKKSWPLIASIILYGFYGSYFVVLSVVTLAADFSNGLIAELTIFLLFSVVFVLSCVDGIRCFREMDRGKQ